jgi:hypothetical protein
MVVTRPDGELVVVAGASRSGKTTYVVDQVRAAPRLLVWDAKGEWWRHDCRTITQPAELRELVARNPPAVERVAYARPCTPAEFDFFCRCAWVWIRQARGALVVEETADVTNPGKAPTAWGEILRKGLAFGPAIYAVTQRPSESDKTAIGNCSRVHCHRMGRAADARYMAAELRVDVAEVERLKPFEWIERDALGQVTRGTGSRRSRGRPRKPAQPAV